MVTLLSNFVKYATHVSIILLINLIEIWIQSKFDLSLAQFTLILFSTKADSNHQQIVTRGVYASENKSE